MVISAVSRAGVKIVTRAKAKRAGAKIIAKTGTRKVKTRKVKIKRISRQESNVQRVRNVKQKNRVIQDHVLKSTTNEQFSHTVHGHIGRAVVENIKTGKRKIVNKYNPYAGSGYRIDGNYPKPTHRRILPPGDKWYNKSHTETVKEAKRSRVAVAISDARRPKSLDNVSMSWDEYVNTPGVMGIYKRGGTSLPPLEKRPRKGEIFTRGRYFTPFGIDFRRSLLGKKKGRR